MRDVLNVRVSSVESLADLCALFHDFPFALDAQQFEPVSRTWTGYFLRGSSDPDRAVTTRWLWLFKVMKFPVVEVRVTIHNVVDAEIQDRAQIGTYTLRQVHRTTSGCCFEFHQDCDIYVDVDGPFEADVSDVGELSDTEGRVASFGFVDSAIQVGSVRVRPSGDETGGR